MGNRWKKGREGSRHILVFALTALVVFLHATLGVNAQAIDPKSRALLDFIGNIEGPAGYDDYYRGVSKSPPQPLSTMSIKEVLAWQDDIDAESRSEAAGRYQIMEDTLRELVIVEGIDPNTKFTSGTQDQLAMLLLKRRGWDPKRTDYENMGNAIAYEWAALPLVSGFRKGRSAYDGLAGNSAQTTVEAYLAVLESGADPAVLAWALEQSSIGTTGTGGTGRVRNILDEFIRDYKNTFYDLSDRMLSITTSLLFGLFVIEWVWNSAQLAIRGADIKEHMSSAIRRLLLCGAFLFFINMGNFSNLIIRSADSLLGETTSGATINVVAMFDRVLAMSLDLSARSFYSFTDRIAAVIVLFIGIGIVGLILISYMEVFLVFAASYVALGFGAFSGTRHLAINYLKRSVGRVFRLFTALFCGAIMSILLDAELNTDSGDSFILVSVMLLLFFIITKAPQAVESAVTGSILTSSGETAAVAALRSPRKIARFFGVPLV